MGRVEGVWAHSFFSFLRTPLISFAMQVYQPSSTAPESEGMFRPYHPSKAMLLSLQARTGGGCLLKDDRPLFSSTLGLTGANGPLSSEPEQRFSFRTVPAPETSGAADAVSAERKSHAEEAKADGRHRLGQGLPGTRREELPRGTDGGPGGARSTETQPGDVDGHPGAAPQELIAPPRDGSGRDIQALICIRKEKRPLGKPKKKELPAKYRSNPLATGQSPLHQPVLLPPPPPKEQLSLYPKPYHYAPGEKKPSQKEGEQKPARKKEPWSGQEPWPPASPTNSDHRAKTPPRRADLPGDGACAPSAPCDGEPPMTSRELRGSLTEPASQELKPGSSCSGRSGGTPGGPRAGGLPRPSGEPGKRPSQQPSQVLVTTSGGTESGTTCPSSSSFFRQGAKIIGGKSRSAGYSGKLSSAAAAAPSARTLPPTARVVPGGVLRRGEGGGGEGSYEVAVMAGSEQATARPIRPAGYWAGAGGQGILTPCSSSRSSSAATSRTRAATKSTPSENSTRGHGEARPDAAPASRAQAQTLVSGLATVPPAERRPSPTARKKELVPLPGAPWDRTRAEVEQELAERKQRLAAKMELLNFKGTCSAAFGKMTSLQSKKLQQKLRTSSSEQLLGTVTDQFAQQREAQIESWSKKPNC